jgi:hypothetical protein
MSRYALTVAVLFLSGSQLADAERRVLTLRIVAER